MKSFTTNLMAAAAALVAVAGSASAQTLKVEIPFAFNAAGARLAPGTYRVTTRATNSGMRMIQLQNLDLKDGVIAISHPGKDAPSSWVAAAQAMLSFSCVEGRCELRTVWFGQSDQTMAFPASRHSKSEMTGVEVIHIRAAKAD